MRANAEAGAIYCLIPHLHAGNQTGVDLQEQRCRELARVAGVRVDSQRVYVDNLAAAWLEERHRPAWRALLSAVRSGAVSQLFLYDPERLSRLGSELLRLLDAVDEFGVVLHWFGDARDLNDPAERQALREEMARADGAASLVSVAARAADAKAAADGRPHGGGRRAYGYEANTYGAVDAETDVVRDIYRRFLDGWSLRAIALDLNERGVPTVGGGRWSTSGVSRILDAPRYAGLRVFRGDVMRAEGGTGYVLGAWEACVGVEEWERVRELRRFREQAAAAARRPRAHYPLTGLLRCTACGRSMVGEVIGSYRTYACTSKSDSVRERCTRHIAANPLEAFVEESAIRILEEHVPGGLVVEPVAVRTAAPGSGARQEVRAVTVRAAEALDGVVTGPGARFAWRRLTPERREAVVHVLFSVVRVGPSSTVRSVFDHGRIEPVANPVRSAHQGC